MASVIYNSFLLETGDGTLDLGNDSFKVMLVTSSYSPNIDTHSKRSSVTNEVVGTGYVAGGQALTGVTWTQDNAGNRAVWDANDVTWANSLITARGAVIYRDTGNAATDNLCMYIDFGTDISTTNGPFEIRWAATGILDKFQTP